MRAFGLVDELDRAVGGLVLGVGCTEGRCAPLCRPWVRGWSESMRPRPF